jgi:hypothetical protein
LPILKLWEWAQTLTHDNMKRSELRQLIREVIEEVQQADEGAFTKAKNAIGAFAASTPFGLGTHYRAKTYHDKIWRNLSKLNTIGRNEGGSGDNHYYEEAEKILKAVFGRIKKKMDTEGNYELSDSEHKDVTKYLSKAEEYYRMYLNVVLQRYIKEKGLDYKGAQEFEKKLQRYKFER